MKTNLILATTLLICTPFAFAKAPSPDFHMDAPAMPEILMDAPAMPDVVMEAPQGPPPAQGQGPEMHGQGRPGPAGMRGHEGPGGMDRGMGPHGMWWKNPEVITAIGLTPDQQKKIEDLFIRSRVQLIVLHSTLEQEQVLLEPVLDANPVDQNAAMAAIDKIANSRADLEKANAKMLLSIRGVLTPDQWTKLQAQHEHPRGPGGPGGKRGPEGPGGHRVTPPSAPPTED